MENRKYKVTVEIMGDHYTLVGDVPPDRVLRMSESLNKRMKDIQQSHPRLPLTKIAVLAALQIMEEAARLEDDYQRLLHLLQEVPGQTERKPGRKK